MRTEDLIGRLAQEPKTAAFAEGRVFGGAVAAVTLCTGAFLGLAGARADLAAALAVPAVAAKTLLPALIFVLSLRAAVTMARPGVAVRPVVVWYALPVAVALVLWLRAFAVLPPGQRFAEVGAYSLSECVGLITLLSVGPTAVVLGLLRDGASLRPRLSGFVAGLAAASGAATGYSLFCVQDNPLFFVTWYGFTILLVAGVGALLGGRFLRW